jgi:uracil phosphoribosyltransferase
MVINLSDSSGVHQVFLSELRNPVIQQNRAAFRANMQKLGQILAYEISKKLPYKITEVESPLGSATQQVPVDEPVLCCILRAGLFFYQGFQDYFVRSDAGFIGAYRGKSQADHSFDIELNYEALPSTIGKTVILIDPMLATGKSMLKAAKLLMDKGPINQLIVASLIASPEGISFLQNELPGTNIWTISIDQGLNDHAYIVPGLGDAGDLSFGVKLG